MLRNLTASGVAMLAANAVVSSFYWYAAFFTWIGILIVTIIHCVKRVRPVWATILVIAGLVFFPLVAVAIYWLVYVIVVVLRRPSEQQSGTPYCRSARSQ